MEHLSHATTDLDLADEDILTNTVPDEALEVAAESRRPGIVLTMYNPMLTFCPDMA